MIVDLCVPCETMSETVEEKQMKQGKLQLGNDAVPVEYELKTVLTNNKRLTNGRLILRQTPGAQLAIALTKLTGANLVTDDGQVLRVEFTNNLNGSEIEFTAPPPRGVIVNR